MVTATPASSSAKAGMPSPHGGGGRPDPRPGAPGWGSAVQVTGRVRGQGPLPRRHIHVGCMQPLQGPSPSPAPSQLARVPPQPSLAPAGSPLELPSLFGSSAFPTCRAETLGPPCTPRHQSRPACLSASPLFPHAGQLQPAHCIHASSSPLPAI